MAESNYRQLSLVCKQCNLSFISNRKKKYCSKRCTWTAQDRKRGVKPKVYKPIPVCLTCGAQFRGKPSSIQIKEGGPKYCSRPCYNNHRFGDKAIRDKAKSELMAQKEHLVLVRKIIGILKRLLAKKLYAEQSSNKKYTHESKLCQWCSKAVGYTFGRGKLFCSKQCRASASKANPEYKALKKIRKQKYKKRLKNNFVEYVDPAYVHKRDKGRCKLCNVKTPMSLRGTYHDNAPEVDHIVALAKGGEHSYLNTQLLCRRCNMNKSDKDIGQLRLVA